MESLTEGRTLLISSHPNHEIALYGFLQRAKQLQIVFLTDGGGPQRIAQSQAGLEAIGVKTDRESSSSRMASCWFRNFTEKEFYDATLKRDVRFFGQVAEDVVRRAIDGYQPDHIVCDAVEYYNPVHDLTLPLVLRALGPKAGSIPVFEVPLVYQKSGSQLAFEVQRPMRSRQSEQRRLVLSDEELQKKLHAWRNIYTILLPQFGPLIPDIEKHGREEFLMQAVRPGKAPPTECMLRYDHRGAELARKGEVQDVITHDDHWLPTVQRLLAA